MTIAGKHVILGIAGHIDHGKTELIKALPVDRVFTLEGHGTIVTGTLWSGSIGPGDKVEIYPKGETARVRGVQVHDQAVEAGVHALRINPGNIGARERVEALVGACADRGIPIRIGVNSGSLEKDILERDGHPTPEGMVESAARQVELVEGLGFTSLLLSLKASNVGMTVEANRLMAARCDIPFHLGVTEAGTVLPGAVRSSVGLSLLLAEGIGDTIRVSLAGPSEEEICVGREILKSLGLRHGGVTVIACPTCGRCEIDVQAIAKEIERETAHIRTSLVVAVMGCAVNGPGEAREADVGVAGGGSETVLFRHGESVERLPGGEVIGRLLSEIRSHSAGSS